MSKYTHMVMFDNTTVFVKAKSGKKAVEKALKLYGFEYGNVKKSKKDLDDTRVISDSGELSYYKIINKKFIGNKYHVLLYTKSGSCLSYKIITSKHITKKLLTWYMKAYVDYIDGLYQQNTSIENYLKEMCDYSDIDIKVIIHCMTYIESTDPVVIFNGMLRQLEEDYDITLKRVMYKKDRKYDYKVEIC